LCLVHEFHRAFGLPVLAVPDISNLGRAQLRLELLQEELDELQDAIRANDKVEVLDALIDLQYVLDGTFHEFGMAHLKEAGLNEVHDSNMSKLDENGQPIYRDDGKVLKGPNFKEPNLRRLL
jgi:predicted HAD superfamily Cof-like phosphohydrolase